MSNEFFDKKSLHVLLLFLIFVSINSHSQESIKTHESVEINGISQWIGARGDDDSKPLLLFLHGGPGFSSRNYSKKFIKYLKKEFIVAQWDQRETGITAHWGPYEKTLTLDLFYQDTEQVIQYLLERFSKKKIYLVGFSWGGFLGMHFADKHPELLHAYISVSSMFFQNQSEQMTLNLLKEQSNFSNNQEAIDEIATIKIPFTSPDDLYYLRKWTFHYLNKTKIDYSMKLVQEWGQKWMPLYLQAAQVDYSKTVSKLDCPVYFFHSDRDYVSNYLVAENFFKEVIAKEKHVIWFHESTHEIPTQEPKKFSEELLKILK